MFKRIREALRRFFAGALDRYDDMDFSADKPVGHEMPFEAPQAEDTRRR